MIETGQRLRYVQVALSLSLLFCLLSVSPGQDEKKAEQLFKTAQALLQQDNYEEARVIFNQIVKSYPKTTYAAKSQELAADNALLKVEQLVNNGSTCSVENSSKCHCERP